MKRPLNTSEKSSVFLLFSDNHELCYLSADSYYQDAKYTGIRTQEIIITSFRWLSASLESLLVYWKSSARRKLATPGSHLNPWIQRQDGLLSLGLDYLIDTQIPSVIFLSFAERTNGLLNKMYFQNAFNIQHFVTVGCETSCPTVTRCDCCRILNLPTNTQSHYVNSALLRYHRPILSISLPLI